MKTLVKFLKENLSNMNESLIAEAFSCSYFKEIANQLKEIKRPREYEYLFGVKNWTFKELNEKNRFLIPWDKLKDDDFIVYKKDDNSKDKKAIIKNVLSDEDNIEYCVILLRDPETNKFMYLISPAGFIVSLTDNTGIIGNALKRAVGSWNDKEYKNITKKDRKAILDDYDIYYAKLSQSMIDELVKKAKERKDYKDWIYSIEHTSKLWDEYNRKLGKIDLSKGEGSFVKDFDNRIKNIKEMLEKIETHFNMSLCLIDYTAYLHTTRIDTFERWIKEYYDSLKSGDAEKVGLCHRNLVNRLKETEDTLKEIIKKSGIED